MVRKGKLLFSMKYVAVMLVFFGVFCTSPCFSQELRYLKYNVHFQEQFSRSGDAVYIASYANYTDPGTGHMILAPNTQVSIGKARKGFSLIDLNGGKTIIFEFNKKNMRGMEVEEYIDLITSLEPVSLTGYSEVDLEGIKEGKALLGMTKKGVMTALGYPAKHRTPSLDDNTYVYWRNRFATCGVDFNDAGIVISVR